MQKTSLLLLLLAGVAWTQPLPQNGQIYQSKKCDLNGDGQAERVELAAYRIHKPSDSFWGQLRVRDHRGKLLWQAPQAKKSGDDFAFGSWPYGVSDLEFLGHLTGDAKVVELLSPRSQSDARPPTYRRYRWTGSAFQPVPSKMLLESPAGSGTFAWTDPREWDGQPLTWVMKISGDSANPRASIYSSQDGGQALVGEANVVFNAKGLRVTSWVKKPSPTSKRDGAPVLGHDSYNKPLTASPQIPKRP